MKLDQSLIRMSVVTVLAIGLTPAVLAQDVPSGQPVPGGIPLPQVLPEGNAFGVNTSGTVVGAIQDESRNEAFAWNAPKIVMLGTLGGDFSIAFAVNDTGLVVGQAETDKVDRGGQRVAQAFV